MAEASINQGAQKKDESDPLAGGTQPVEASRHISKDTMSGGTPDTTAPSGGALPEPPSEAVPRTEVGRDQPGQPYKEHTPNEEGPGAKKV